MITKKFVIGLLFTFFAFFIIGQTQVHAAVTDTVFGQAWSDDIGWIDFNNCTSPTSCSGTSYGVKMDPLTGNLSGQAWSDNIGWTHVGLPWLVSHQPATI